MKGVETVKVDEMQAGREMDALVAEYLGWKCYKEKRGEYTLAVVQKPGDVEPWRHTKYECQEAEKTRYTQISCIEGAILGFFGNGFPTYSTDIVAAWEVRAKIQELGLTAVNVTAAGEQPYCQFVKPIDEDSIEEHIAYADKDPLAICRASLKAILGSDEV